MRKKKFILNTGFALINQAIALICGFILPRQILLHYGSEINGLVSSITQFLGFVTLMEMGVGAVVQSALYKPIADKKQDDINQIMASANHFFSNIAKVLIGYTLILMVIYPLFINRDYGFMSTAVLVAAISISSIAQYFFGITNQIFLNADQKAYIPLIAQSTVTVLNTIVSIVLISLGTSIHIVKLGSSLVLLIRPFILNIYVSKKYHINKKVVVRGEPIKQKWNGLAQHIATFVVDRTDIAVLTIMSTLSNVSIYYVYHLVVTGLYQLFITLTTGAQSLLGDMYAKGEKEKLNATFTYMEWLSHTGVSFLFGCAGVLMIPFVSVYTKGINDANYLLPAFSCLITLAYAMYSLRGFYNIIVKAVGHYKETQNGAVIEAFINIIVSVALVWKYGLIGVAIGTLLAMCYRTFYFTFYLGKHILNRSIKVFMRNLLIDALSISLIYALTRKIVMIDTTYFAFAVAAIQVCIISGIIILVVNLIFNRSYILPLIKKVCF